MYTTQARVALAAVKRSIYAVKAALPAVDMNQQQVSVAHCHLIEALSAVERALAEQIPILLDELEEALAC